MSQQTLPLPVNSELCSHFNFLEIGRKLREEDAYQQHSKSARVLARGDAFSMTLVALKMGAQLKEHRSPGPATAIVLEGQVLFHPATQKEAWTLTPMTCAVFSPEIPHSVLAEKPTLMLIIFGQK